MVELVAGFWCYKLEVVGQSPVLLLYAYTALRESLSHLPETQTQYRHLFTLMKSFGFSTGWSPAR